MEKPIKLSIAIPTYNRSRFLQEALESIVAQLVEGVDIVVSDNGSSDDTLQVLETYKKNYPIHVCGFSANQGIDRNIVHVMENSQGEYLHLFGDDDLLMPGALAQILTELYCTAPTLMCLNHFAFHNHSLQDRQPPFLPKKRKVFSQGEQFFRYCGLGFLSSLIIRRQEAMRYLTKVRFGKECAHVDIAARVALQKDALCVYLGSVAIAGRSLDTPRYHMMCSCVLYLKELYDELLQERLLSCKLHRFFMRRLLYKEIPRISYKMRKNQENLLPAKKLLKEAFPSKMWIDWMMQDRSWLLWVFATLSLFVKAGRWLSCKRSSRSDR